MVFTCRPYTLAAAFLVACLMASARLSKSWGCAMNAITGVAAMPLPLPLLAALPLVPAVVTGGPKVTSHF